MKLSTNRNSAQLVYVHRLVHWTLTAEVTLRTLCTLPFCNQVVKSNSLATEEHLMETELFHTTYLISLQKEVGTGHETNIFCTIKIRGRGSAKLYTACTLFTQFTLLLCLL